LGKGWGRDGELEEKAKDVGKGGIVEEKGV
jgi:hypothetical protein